MAFVLDNWVRLVETSTWETRGLHRCINVGDYIYMTGGTNATNKFSEVWRSLDGVTWELLTDSPGWAARSAHGFIYNNGKFWVFGGSTDLSVMLNDVWSSEDAVNWTQVTAAASWSPRHEFAFCVHNGKMYLSGGFDGLASFYKDVYSSIDGISWTLDSSDFGASLREHIMVSFLGNLLIYGGNFGATNYNTIRYSTDDGATWNFGGFAAWGPRKEHQYVKNASDDLLAIIGGATQLFDYYDVWSTADGFNFTEITQEDPYPARSDFGLVDHNNRAFIVGGRIGTTFNNDVWAAGLEPKIVSYYGNGNITGTVPAPPTEHDTGTTVTVLDNVDLFRNNYMFNGWNTSADGTGTSYNPGDTFEMGSEDVSLYAQWLVRFAGGLIGNSYPNVNTIYSNVNYSGFSSYGDPPPNPTQFTLLESTVLTLIEVPHVNNNGTPPGTVSFQHTDLTIYGPYQLLNAFFWYIDLSIEQLVLPAGTYTVIDSNPECWSHNAISGDCGMINLQGGSATKEVFNSYWDIETSGRTESDGGIGKTTNEMKIKGTPGVYETWDFVNIWFMNDNE